MTDEKSCKNCGKEIILVKPAKSFDYWVHKETNKKFCYSDDMAEPKGDCKSPILQMNTSEGEHE